MASKPRVFIGSSVGGISIAAAIHENLKHSAEVTPWNQGAFELSKTTIESLTQALDTSDYGIFVFSRDDVVNLKGKRYSAVRDNVLFELGLFIGRLGRERTFIVAPDDADAAKEIKLRIPTDLVGITLGTFESSRTDGNLTAATGSFANSVKTAIAKLGKIRPDESSESVSDSKTESKSIKDSEQQIQDDLDLRNDWNSLFAEKRYNDALVMINKSLTTEKNSKEINELQLAKAQCIIFNDSNKGYELLEDFYNKNSDDSDLVKKIINIFLKNSQNNRALELAQIAFNKFPTQESFVLFMHQALNELGKPEEALEILKNNPNNVLAVIKLVDILEEEEEYAKAVSVIHKAYIKHTNSAQIMLRFSKLMLAHDNPFKDYEISLFLSDKLVKQWPEHNGYTMYVGFSCSELGLFDIALRAYKKVEEKRPSALTYSNIGSIYKEQGLYEEAKSYFKKALDDENATSLQFSHNKMTELLQSQEEDRKRYAQYIKAGRVKANTPPPPKPENIQ